MRIVDLNGKWTLQQADRKTLCSATVPGCVHTDLLAAGRIADPFYRDNETALQWMGRTDWIYSRTFDARDLADFPRVRLVCDGLDTLATVTLNGIEIGRADNMYRTWEFDVKATIRTGRNTIAIRFAAPESYLEKRSQTRKLHGWAAPHEPRGRAWLRKEPCNFGWDWGPVLVTSGIWRPLRLVGFRTARLTDVHIRQDHGRSGDVGLNVTVAAETIAPDARLFVCARVAFQGRVIAETHADLVNGGVRLSLRVADPQLWWPNGMGGQPLYNVVIEVRQRDTTLVDVTSRRIGLRTLRLDRHPDRWGESFQFVVNGMPFFAKGANWIPSDTFVTRLTWDDYAALIGAAAAANMNMLRVWGGGIYEQDAFYDLCDEHGICLWQDFMFACSVYPAFDDAFMANVREEAVQNVRRLRHHPSLALWCGNNELEQGLVGDVWNDSQMSWEDYGKLFDKLLPDVVQAEDPDHDYWPCSPHTPPPGDRKNFNDPTRGDAHLWEVWHGRKPFEWYRTCEHRFNSEFGFQSFPEPLTVRAYTAPADRNVTTYVMEKHQRSGIGNTVIMQYLLDWFRLPAAFDRTLCLTQILQGMAIKYAVEHWRRSMPRGMGTLYWQLNDCWPVASWASIDYYKRWKALHYMARDFYAPLLISGLENIQLGTVEIHVTSDRMTDARGEVGWTLTDLNGRRLAGGRAGGIFKARTSCLVTTVDVKRFLDQHGARGLLFWLDLTEKRRRVSGNLLLFARPKHLELPDPKIRATVKHAGDAWVVTLTARHPALWAWVELDGVPAAYSNNYLHLRAGEPVTIEVTPEQRLTAAGFKRRLRVSSLVDTY